VLLLHLGLVFWLGSCMFVAVVVFAAVVACVAVVVVHCMLLQLRRFLLHVIHVQSKFTAQMHHCLR
jgi:hypothetical protein